jgi:hypothetical protein
VSAFRSALAPSTEDLHGLDRVLGVAVVLGLLPALSMLGFGAIAVVPTLAAVATFQVLRLGHQGSRHYRYCAFGPMAR